MASLRDRSFDRRAWFRIGGVTLVLAAIGAAIWGSTVLHREFVTKPGLMANRYADPPGVPGLVTTQITRLGAEAVPVLLGDLGRDRPVRERVKALEMLSAIDDPRVIPALVKGMGDEHVAIRMAAMAGLARTGDKAAFEPLWKLRNEPEELFRYRLYVALGLVAAPGQIDRLIAAANKFEGRDRLLLYWAAGYAQRRADSAKKGEYARPTPGPGYKDKAGAAELKAQIDELRRKIDAGEGAAKDLAKELARLTSVRFTTWDFAHQIALQTIEVTGPGAVRAMARIDRDPMPPPELVPLQLDTRSKRER